MAPFYVFGSQTNTLPIPFIDSTMRMNFGRMADYCGIQLQLPADIAGQFPAPPYPSGLVIIGYMQLLQALSSLDQAYANHNLYEANAFLENLLIVSNKKGHWLYNEFYLPTNYSLPIYGTKTFIKKETSGAVNDPINPHIVL